MQVRDVVHEHPVNFFWHAFVVGPQTSLHMRDRYPKLRRTECGGKSRIGVAVDNQHRRPIGQQNRLDLLKHPPGLQTVGAGSDAEVNARGSDVEMMEEDVGHRLVIVLPSVNQAIPEHRRRAEQARPLRPSQIEGGHRQR